MNTNQIPVLLITGYLGSGKTTLLNRILNNNKNIRFAVIVNDIGEVNIDAELIQKGGIVGQNGNDDLVALQNGCICCTLKMDLMKQLADIAETGNFDYIAIEASGICEPEPIAKTILSMPSMHPALRPMPVTDCIVSVVDALRLKSEFDNGEKLTDKNISEEDIENLVIQQIEFCNIILLNKISEVSEEEVNKIKAILRAIQPQARILECDFCNIPLADLLQTHVFDYNKTATSATWIQQLDSTPTEDEHEHKHEHSEEHCHCHEHDHEHDGDHCHCHHHHHDEGEAEEYGIGTFVYYRRKPFDLNRLDHFLARNWPANIIRCKGMIWLSQNNDMCYLFEQAGIQKKLTECGFWCATAPADELAAMLENDPSLRRDWDNKCGDRMTKLVFIGRNLDKESISSALDKCLQPD